MPGDWTSVSTTPMRGPSAASSVATLAVVFDLPVPPRNEWMAMILDMVGPLSVRRGRMLRSATICRASRVSVFTKAQLVRLSLQILKIVSLGNLGHLASGSDFIDLDAELLHLLFQAPLTGTHFARHSLEHPCQLPQLVAPGRNPR